MIESLKELIQRKDLVWYIFLRDLKAGYKGAIFSFLWVIFLPLFTLFVFIIIFSRFPRFGVEGIPYPVFAISGIVPWFFIISSLNSASESLKINSFLIKSVYFPREVLPICSVLSKFHYLLVGWVISIFLLIFHKIKIGLNLFYLPFCGLLLFLFAIGAGLLLSLGNFFFRDVGFAFNILSTVWLFLTPVFYPVSLWGKKFKFLLYLNPASSLCVLHRSILINSKLPSFDVTFTAILWALFTFILGLSIFHKLEHLLPKNA